MHYWSEVRTFYNKNYSVFALFKESSIWEYRWKFDIITIAMWPCYDAATKKQSKTKKNLGKSYLKAAMKNTREN